MKGEIPAKAIIQTAVLFLLLCGPLKAEELRKATHSRSLVLTNAPVDWYKLAFSPSAARGEPRRVGSDTWLIRRLPDAVLAGIPCKVYEAHGFEGKVAAKEVTWFADGEGFVLRTVRTGGKHPPRQMVRRVIGLTLIPKVAPPQEAAEASQKGADLLEYLITDAATRWLL